MHAGSSADEVIRKSFSFPNPMALESDESLRLLAGEVVSNPLAAPSQQQEMVPSHQHGSTMGKAPTNPDLWPKVPLRIPCTCCGHFIITTVAEETGGCCMVGMQGWHAAAPCESTHAHVFRVHRLQGVLHGQGLGQALLRPLVSQRAIRGQTMGERQSKQFTSKWQANRQQRNFRHLF